jgi:hypothetical protein
MDWIPGDPSNGLKMSKYFQKYRHGEIEIKAEPIKAESIQVAVPVKKKSVIPKKVKTDVWNTYISPHINAHLCLCCKKTIIQITDFQLGHVQSEKDGGTTEIGNLRPICSACNFSMGTTNMVEFVKKYGYYIG